MKNLLLLGLIALLSFPVWSQQKGEKKFKKVEQIYPVYIEVCDLKETQKEALYDLLVERQVAIQDCKKSCKGSKEAASEATLRIRNEYHEKIEQLIGLENMEKIKEYKSSQMHFDLKDLEAML